MRSFSVVASLLLAGSAYAQSSAVFTPSQRDLSVPTYVNATVVSVNTRNNTVRFRSASGEVSLAVDSQKVRNLGRLRAGDQVVLGYTLDDRGRPGRIVNAMLAGEELASRGLPTNGNSAVSTLGGSPFSTVSGRVVRTDAAAGTIVISDALGRTETLSVRGASALTSLGMVMPGDEVNVSFVPGAALGGVGVFGTVNGITPALGPSFVTGTVARIDSTTGTVTLRTPFGEQVFAQPPSGVDLRTLRTGQDVRLGLSGRAGDRSFTTVNTLGGAAVLPSTFATPNVVTSGRTGTLPFTTTNMPAGGGTIVGGAAIPGTPGVVGRTGFIPGSAGTVVGGVATVPPTTGNFAGNVPSAVGGAPGTPTTGAQFNSPLAGQVNAGGAAGVNNATGFAGNGLNSANVGLGTGVGTLSFPASPFSQVIPQIPSVTGQLNVVPPPTAAPASPETLPVGAARDVAARDYDYAVNALAMKANEIDAHWFRYRDGCLRSNSTNSEIDRNMFGSNRDRQWYGLFNGDVRTPADDNCRQLMIEMTRMATDWRNNMTRVEDTARSNDVLPGSMRDIRRRYRVDF